MNKLGFKDFVKKGVSSFKEYNTPENRKKRTRLAIEREQDLAELDELRYKREKLKHKGMKLKEERQKNRPKMRDPFEFL